MLVIVCVCRPKPFAFIVVIVMLSLFLLPNNEKIITVWAEAWSCCRLHQWCCLKALTQCRWLHVCRPKPFALTFIITEWVSSGFFLCLINRRQDQTTKPYPSEARPALAERSESDTSIQTADCSPLVSFVCLLCLIERWHDKTTKPHPTKARPVPVGAQWVSCINTDAVFFSLFNFLFWIGSVLEPWLCHMCLVYIYFNSFRPHAHALLGLCCSPWWYHVCLLK